MKYAILIVALLICNISFAQQRLTMHKLVGLCEKYANEHKSMTSVQKQDFVQDLVGMEIKQRATITNVKAKKEKGFSLHGVFYKKSKKITRTRFGQSSQYEREYQKISFLMFTQDDDVAKIKKDSEMIIEGIVEKIDIAAAIVELGGSKVLQFNVFIKLGDTWNGR